MICSVVSKTAGADSRATPGTGEAAAISAERAEKLQNARERLIAATAWRLAPATPRNGLRGSPHIEVFPTDRFPAQYGPRGPRKNVMLVILPWREFEAGPWLYSADVSRSGRTVPRSGSEASPPGGGRGRPRGRRRLRDARGEFSLSAQVREPGSRERHGFGPGSVGSARDQPALRESSDSARSRAGLHAAHLDARAHGGPRDGPPRSDLRGEIRREERPSHAAGERRDTRRGKAAGREAPWDRANEPTGPAHGCGARERSLRSRAGADRHQDCRPHSGRRPASPA